VLCININERTLPFVPQHNQGKVKGNLPEAFTSGGYIGKLQNMEARHESMVNFSRYSPFGQFSVDKDV